MTSTNNNDCPDLTPENNCNDSCCPEYEPTEDWCKAFNKRTLDQQRKSQQSSIDGMWLNLSDARNTIGQAEQYIAVIYELLLAIQDQIVKVSSQASATVSDYDSSNAQIKEYLTEINQIANGAQYNGRLLLKGSFGNPGADGTAGNTDDEITSDTPDIVFRFMGCVGFCRTVDITTNDFTYSPPGVSLDHLFTSVDGAGAPDGADPDTPLLTIVGGDISGDQIDPAIKKVNCAIGIVGVQLDKLRAYRQILCLREKQIKICKNGQDICYEHKCKL